MLTKAVVFLFCTITVFGLFISNIPYDLAHSQTWISPEVKAVSTYFNKNNYTLYSSNAYGTMNLSGFPYARTDINTTLSSSDFLELYWEDYNPPWLERQHVIYMKHATQQWLYKSSHDLKFTLSNNMELAINPVYITYQDITADWNLTGNNDCVFYGSCDHLSVTLILVSSNTTFTLMEAWNGYCPINWYLSYETNINGSAFSIWTLLSDLFSFKYLNLGITGVAGTILDGCIGAFMIALVLVVIYKLTTGLIPWISGGSGD